MTKPLVVLIGLAIIVLGLSTQLTESPFMTKKPDVNK